MKNRGVITKSRFLRRYAKDKFGSIQIADWTPYLPINEVQSDSLGDTMACVTYSSCHCIETQINYLLSINAFPQQAVIYFQSAGYLQNGKFEVSPRFSAWANGTRANGNDLITVANAYNKYGLLPKSDWDMQPNMSMADYYTTPPQALIDKAKVILNYVQISYQWIQKSQIPNFLPVQIASEVCAGWDSVSPVPACSGQPIQHATMIYGVDSQGYLDFDTYPPFQQKLSPLYELPDVLKYNITILNPNQQQTISIFQQWLNYISEQFKLVFS